MLRNCRHIDLLFEIDDVGADTSFVLKCFSDQRFTLSGILLVSKILKHSLIRAEQHLEFTNIDSLWRNRVSSNIRANNDTE